MNSHSQKLGLGLFFAGSLFAACNSSGPKTESSKPNILFILVDDLGWADVTCNNPNSFYETPNIDKLASQGVRFSNGYASCPVCSPTRASLMTGKYPARLNITDWIPGRDPKNQRLLGTVDEHNLALSEVTIAETLKESGYTTGFFGKWHLGETEEFWPEHQGFDINIGGHHKGSPPGGYYSPYKNPRLTNGPEGEYLPDRLTDETIHFIKTNQQKPFFAYLSFYTVHTPIQASKRHLDKFKKKLKELKIEETSYRDEHDGITRITQADAAYASMVYAMDENVGRLMAQLKELNLDKNTIVVFTSDNGGLSTLYRKGAPTSNEPLRAGKGWCYEGGIRVPFIIKTPQQKQPGRVIDQPVISNDFYPTILDLAGIPMKPNQHKDGASLKPILTEGNTIDRETLYWHYPHYHGSAWTPGAALRHNEWKLVEFYDKEKVELYNLKDDPSEQTDLAVKHPEKLKELKDMLKKWQTEMNAKFPIPNPNYKVK
ncbi:DUF4976 domain-containing protein [Puteibacter caeruleilacunae]|nr:DUF4976 domain-containing protein [Puteibacter caeruleilacunae]